MNSNSEFPSHKANYGFNNIKTTILSVEKIVSHLWVQSNNGESKGQNKCHYNEKDIKTTVVTGRVEPNE